MKKVIKLTESDLAKIVKRVISEQPSTRVAPSTGSIPTTNTAPSTGQASGSKGPTPVQSSQRPIGSKPNADVVISPQIKIDCKKRVIVSTQLPKLDKNANFTIINHYCNK